MANSSKGGDAKSWVYSRSRGHDRQAAEDHKMKFFTGLPMPGLFVFTSELYKRIVPINGKPVERRGRKTMGLQLLPRP